MLRMVAIPRGHGAISLTVKNVFPLTKPGGGKGGQEQRVFEVVFTRHHLG